MTDKLRNTNIADGDISGAKLTDATVGDVKIAALSAGKLIGTISNANLNVGTGANQLLTLDASGRLPAIDASQLTNLPTSYAPLPAGAAKALDLSAAAYSVPVGSTLYVVTAQTAAGQMTIDGVGFWALGGTSVFAAPFVVPGGSQVSGALVTGIETASGIGFARNLSLGSYLVPSGKTLYIHTTTPGDLYIDGKHFVSAPTAIAFASPLVVPGGSTLSGANGSTCVTGIER